jgi:hypothetical protein
VYSAHAKPQTPPACAANQLSILLSSANCLSIAAFTLGLCRVPLGLWRGDVRADSAAPEYAGIVPAGMDAGSTAGWAILGERRALAGEGGRRESTSINGLLLPRMLIGSPIDALIAPRTCTQTTQH